MYFLSEIAILIHLPDLLCSINKRIEIYAEYIISLSLTEVSLLIAFAAEDYIMKNSSVSQNFIMLYFNYFDCIRANVLCFNVGNHIGSRFGNTINYKIWIVFKCKESKGNPISFIFYSKFDLFYLSGACCCI